MFSFLISRRIRRKELTKSTRQFLYIYANYISSCSNLSFSPSFSLLSPIFLLKSIHNFTKMGSSLSLFLIPRDSAVVPPADPGLGDLPESCVASVMVYLNPSEICSLSMLNRAFRAASFADFVWESKLPLNYGSIIDRVFGGVEDFSNSLCKRDIYARLCRPSYFDGGTKVRSLSFCLENFKNFFLGEMGFSSLFFGK